MLHEHSLAFSSAYHMIWKDIAKRCSSRTRLSLALPSPPAPWTNTLLLLANYQGLVCCCCRRECIKDLSKDSHWHLQLATSGLLALLNYFTYDNKYMITSVSLILTLTLCTAQDNSSSLNMARHVTFWMFIEEKKLYCILLVFTYEHSLHKMTHLC